VLPAVQMFFLTDVRVFRLSMQARCRQAAVYVMGTYVLPRCMTAWYFIFVFLVAV